MMELIAHNMAPIMFASLVVFLLLGYPVAFALAANGLLFPLAFALAVITFFGAHVLYGAIVGAGYGHVTAEHQWAPTTRP